MLERLAGFCYRRRWSVVIGWVGLLVGLSVLAGAADGATSDDFDLPDSDSAQALDLLTETGFGSRAGEQVQVVFATPEGVAAPGPRAAMERLFAAIEAGVADVEVVSPYAPEGARQVSADQTIAYAEVNLADRPADARTAAADRIEQLRDETGYDGLRIDLGGNLFGEDAADEEGGVPTELIGIIAAIIILLVAFGSVFAVSLPIVVGVFGAGCGIAVLGLTANLIDMPSFASAAAAMIAIGVGIDYALLVVTRYRENLLAGLEPAGAGAGALATAGRSVLFAGVTVVIGVLGLLFMGLGLINGVAVGIASAVLMTMLAAVTLLPALLGFVGHNIDRFGLPRRRRRDHAHDSPARRQSRAGGSQGSAFPPAHPEAKPNAGEREASRPRRELSRQWSRVIQRRPLLYGGGALAVMVALAVPAADLRLGFGDAGNLPAQNTARGAYDLLSEGFGPGFNGPLLVAARIGGATGPDGVGDTAGDTAAVERLTSVLAATAGVADASPAQFNQAGDAAVIQVVPTTSPQDEATADLVGSLRRDVLPEALAGTGVEAYVGGTTAGAVDYAEYTGDRLPLFVGVVLALSFVLVMAVFRSLLVPLKAVVMNMLTVAATFGALVAVFQWGWGLDVFGFDRAGPVEAWVPMMMFAVVFGLSMDYEVFLVSRMKEEFDRTGDPSFAVSEGLARTSRVISAAAAIMVCVFGSFVFGGERELAIFGFGLAFSILIDATVVRLLLVPSVMQLLGRRAWWLPGRLARLLPTVTVEGRPLPADVEGPARSAPAAVAQPTPTRDDSRLPSR